MSVQFSLLLLYCHIGHSVGICVRWLERRCHIMNCATKWIALLFILYIYISNCSTNVDINNQHRSAVCRPHCVCSAEPSLCCTAVKTVLHTARFTPSHLGLPNKTQLVCHVTTRSSRALRSLTCKRASNQIFLFLVCIAANSVHRGDHSGGISMQAWKWIILKDYLQM